MEFKIIYSEENMVFVFEGNEADPAWYDFDHKKQTETYVGGNIVLGGPELEIDANREAHAILKKNGSQYYCTILNSNKDEEPDNATIDNGGEYTLRVDEAI